MHVARLAEVGQGPRTYNYHFTLVTQLTVTALRFPVLPMRLASSDHLMCMMNLACTCSGELESVYLQAGGNGQSQGGW